MTIQLSSMISLVPVVPATELRLAVPVPVSQNQLSSMISLVPVVPVGSREPAGTTGSRFPTLKGEGTGNREPER